MNKGGKSMLPEDMDYLARKERQKDLLREVEASQLQQKSTGQQEKPDRLDRKAAQWVGQQMVRWGQELQRYSAGPEADEAS
jgi:hypothetical protein